jgi:hypothetical protein
MKNILILSLLLIGFKSFSQDLSGEWQIIHYSNADQEILTDIVWEFGHDTCVWRSKIDNSEILRFNYSISNRTCDGNVIDGDNHLSLYNTDVSISIDEDNGKKCFVILGLSIVDGAKLLSIIEYGTADPILFRYIN